MHRANVHPFMEARVNGARLRLGRITHETVLAALPRMGNDAVEIAVDHLVKLGARSPRRRCGVAVGSFRRAHSARADPLRRGTGPRLPFAIRPPINFLLAHL